MDCSWAVGVRASRTKTCVSAVATVEHQPTSEAKDLDCWSKVMLSDQSTFCISFGNLGPRVWRKRVKFPESVMV